MLNTKTTKTLANTALLASLAAAAGAVGPRGKHAASGRGYQHSSAQKPAEKRIRRNISKKSRKANRGH